MSVLFLLLIAVGIAFFESRRPHPLEPQRVADDLTGKVDRVLHSKKWADLGIRPPGFLRYSGAEARSSDRMPIVQTEVHDIDIDGDGFDDAFVLLGFGGSCASMVLMYEPYEGWACAGIVGEYWYEHGFDWRNPPWPTVEHHGGMVFLLSYDGWGGLGFRTATQVHCVEQDTLRLLWREVADDAFSGLNQRVRLISEGEGVILESTAYRDVRDVDGGFVEETVLIRRWRVRGGVLSPIAD